MLRREFVVAVVLAIVITIGVAAFTAPALAQSKQKPLVVVIALGLMGKNPTLEAMMHNITEVNWKVITGSFTYDDIKDAKMIIFVQVDPTYKVTDKMAQAIAKWFKQGGKTLWVTGDSDYSGGDYMRIPNTNKILEAVGSHLRNDNCEVEDPVLNAGKPYRVTALIEPSPELAVLAGGVYKPVLFHGPGAMAIVYNGKWYPFYNNTKPPLPNIYKIAVTSDKATIHEFVKPWPKAYNVLNPPVNSFVLMAAEIFYNNSDIVILSTEAPFDHYAGMYKASYHGKPLGGPTFVKNVILWGVGLLGQRIPKTGEELMSLRQKLSSLQTQLKTLQSKVQSLQSQLSSALQEKSKYMKEAQEYKSKIASLISEVNQYTQYLKQYKSVISQYKKAINEYKSAISQYESNLAKLNNEVTKLSSQVASLNTRQYVLLIIGIIIGLAVGAAIGYAVKRR